jgi:hypothetical protein
MAAFDSASSQRGTALVATLLASALLVAVGSLAAEQAWISWMIGHRLREAAEALVSAESGMAAAIADFAEEPAFERFDLPSGSAFPYLGGAPAAIPLPDSFRIHTGIRARSSSHVDFVVTATGRNRARRVLAATIERSDTPYVPATLYQADSGATISFSDTLAISGRAGAADPIPALGMPAESDAEQTYRQLEAAGASLSGGPTATSWTRLGEIAQRIRSQGAPLPDVVSGAVAEGIWVSAASTEIANAAGRGIWLIDGNLRIRAGFDFEGLLVVQGDIEVEPGAVFEVAGAVAQQVPGSTLQTRGHTRLAYESNVLRGVAALDPDLLDHRATLIGWRDDS